MIMKIDLAYIELDGDLKTRNICDIDHVLRRGATYTMSAEWQWINVREVFKTPPQPCPRAGVLPSGVWEDATLIAPKARQMFGPPLLH